MKGILVNGELGITVSGSWIMPIGAIVLFQRLKKAIPFS
jgi:hypothetical protein